jgi:uncharacterized protein involved in cysteine biosynthesis
MKKTISLTTGLSVLPFAFRLLRKSPILWKWALPPMVISFLVVLFSFSWARGLIDGLILGWIGATSLSSISWINSAVHFLSAAVTLLAFSLVFTWIFLLVSIPFSDPLAEATEKLIGIHPSVDPNHRPVSFAKMLWIDLGKSLLVIFLQMIVFGFALLFFWLPGIQIIIFALNAWLIAFQFLSYPQTRRGLGIFESFRILRSRAFVVWSFGAAIACIYFIPYLSSFLTPIAVIAGTVLYGKIVHPKANPLTARTPEVPSV